MTQADKTRLSMGAIEENLKNNEKEHRDIMDEITGFREDIKKLSLEVAKLPQTMLKLSDERYASKNAERVIYGLVGAVCLGFVLGLIELLKTSHVVA